MPVLLIRKSSRESYSAETNNASDRWEWFHIRYSRKGKKLLSYTLIVDVNSCQFLGGREQLCSIMVCDVHENAGFLRNWKSTSSRGKLLWRKSCKFQIFSIRNLWQSQLAKCIILWYFNGIHNLLIIVVKFTSRSLRINWTRINIKMNECFKRIFFFSF